MPEVVAVSLGLLFLHIFYRAVRLNWPESYFGATELATYAIAISPIRYAAFRLGPVFLTSLFAAVSLDRMQRSGFVGALGIGMGHSLATSGKGLIQAIGLPRPTRRHRIPVFIVWAVVFVGVMLTSVLAWASAGFLGPLVPQPSDLSSSLWTGLLAGVLGAYIATVSRGHPTNEYGLAEDAIKRIPRAMWDLAGAEAVAAGADPRLTRAVMLVENMQRPPWFRKLERLKGRFIPAGTYGIMQVASEGPLGDAESIRKAVKERLAGVVVQDENGNLDYKALEHFARAYNPNANFHALLEGALNTISRHARD